MNFKEIPLSIALIIGSLLLFSFSFIQYKKLRDKIYKPNKEEAKEWPYTDDTEGMSDHSDKVSHVKRMILCTLIFLIGVYKLYQELKFLFE